MEENNKGFEINFEGGAKKQKKYNLKTDTYTARISNVSDMFQTMKWQSTEMESKFTIEFEIPQSTEPAKLAFFVRPKIMHSAKKKGYSDSALYQILERANLLEECKTFLTTLSEIDKDRDQKIIEWLKSVLINRQVRVYIKNVKSAEGEEYSSIQEIIEFTDVVKQETIV